MKPDELQAVILAGGQGTRLQRIITDRPKALAPVAGRPFIDCVLSGLRCSGISNVVLCTGYLAKMLREHVADGAAWNLQVLHSTEAEPLGTAGALRYALPLIESDPVLVLNGDSWCHSNFPEFLAWHARRNSPASLLLTWSEDSASFGSAELDQDSYIRSFREKSEQRTPGWISAGVYLLSRALIESLPAGRPVSLEREVFPALIPSALHGFCVQAPFTDIGTPESYDASHTFFTRHPTDLNQTQ